MEFAVVLEQRPNLPVYRCLSEAIRGAIRAGQLQPGQMLPSVRELASSYGIAPSTVVRSYEDLGSRGYIETAPKTGTYVSKQLPQELTDAAVEPAAVESDVEEPQWSAYARRFAECAEQSVCHQQAYLVNRSTEQLPTKTWERIILRHRHCYEQEPGFLHYGADPLGYEPLREAIASYLVRARGVRCHRDQVVITSATRLDLICRLLLDPGDRVAIDDPCYPVNRRILQSHGAELHPVSIDEDGMQIEQLLNSRDAFKLVYTTPSHQDPTGAVLSLERRRSLLNWAHATGTYIWESDIDSQFRYGSKPIPALQGLDDGAQVIYSASMWAVMGPLVKLGYMVVPPAFIAMLKSVQAVINREVSILEQVALTDFINEGHLERYIHKTRVSYARKRQALFHALKLKLSEQVDVWKRGSGMHLLVRFDPSLSEDDICQAAQDAQLVLMSSRSYYMSEPQAGEFLIPFAALDEAQIPEIVERFAHSLKARI